MKPRSSPSEGLLDALFTSADAEAELSDAALLRAMLDVEAALAQAEADAGIVPVEAAKAIAEVASSASFDIAEIGARAQESGNPVVPLVRALGDSLPESARPWVHFGATSQDVLDTAFMLLVRRCTIILLGDLSRAIDACAALADRHRNTATVARTLGQQAALSTFGLRAAGWLTALDDAAARMQDVLQHRLAVQLGGAAGTLGVLGSAGPDVLGRLAVLLDLAEPALPWHTDRQRVLDVATAAGNAVAAVAKIGLDVELLAQTEIGEVSENGGNAGAHGGSSAMPHKHNPVDAVLIRSAGFRAPGLVSTLFSAAAQHEHERAAGAWHAEWQPLRELLSVAGGAVARTGELLGGLEVHADRMRANVEATNGLLLAENVAMKLAPHLGRKQAQAEVGRCCARAVQQGCHLGEVVRSDDVVLAHLSTAEIDQALDPAKVLRAVGPLIDRALAAHAARR